MRLWQIAALGVEAAAFAVRRARVRPTTSSDNADKQKAGGAGAQSTCGHNEDNEEREAVPFIRWDEWNGKRLGASRTN